MITSSTNQTFKDLLKLKQKKYRDEHYLVEGDHLVDDALRHGVADLIITSDENYRSSLPVFLISQGLMEKLAFTKTPQNVMARVKKVQENTLGDFNRYLVLDGLQDPGNIGTLIRTALALGIEQVILSDECVDLYNDKLLRSAQGAHFRISIIRGDLHELIPRLQANGVFVLATALSGGQPLDLIAKREKMAFVLGNEGNGMNRDIIDLCDGIGFIEIEAMESLNVAIAGSILMYHFKAGRQDR